MATTPKGIAIILIVSFGLSGLAIFLGASYFSITFQVLVFVIAYAWVFIWLVKGAGSKKSRLVWTLAAIVLFIPYVTVTGSVASHAINSFRLERFAAQFLNNPPASSTLSLVQAQVGVLTGMGNHCDFIVEIEITSRLSHNVIEAHYATLPVRRAIAGESSEIQVLAKAIDDGVFLLKATDAPNGAALDIRCH